MVGMVLTIECLELVKDVGVVIKLEVRRVGGRLCLCQALFSQIEREEQGMCRALFGQIEREGHCYCRLDGFLLREGVVFCFPSFLFCFCCTLYTSCVLLCA